MEREMTMLGLTRGELVAALVDDSLGYLNPRGAELHVQEGQRGETWIQVLGFR